MNPDIDSGDNGEAAGGSSGFTREAVLSGIDPSIVPEGMDVNQVLDEANYDARLAAYPPGTSIEEVRSDLIEGLNYYNEYGTFPDDDDFEDSTQSFDDALPDENDFPTTHRKRKCGR